MINVMTKAAQKPLMKLHEATPGTRTVLGTGTVPRNYGASVISLRCAFKNCLYKWSILLSQDSSCHSTWRAVQWELVALALAASRSCWAAQSSCLAGLVGRRNRRSNSYKSEICRRHIRLFKVLGEMAPKGPVVQPSRMDMAKVSGRRLHA